jgi:HKD family nuclease
VILIPHAVIVGNLQIKDIFDELKSLFIKEDNKIIKTLNSFISQDETIILNETLVIEKGNKIQFFSMINQREDGIVVRIYPNTDIEKTDGVKQALAEIAKEILGKFKETSIGKTNLNDYFS